MLGGTKTGISMFDYLSRLNLKKFVSTSALFFAGTLAASLAYSPIASAFGVGVEPSTVEMTIKPGDRHRQVVTIGNVHKTKTISMTMGLADWSLDKNGQLILNPPGETERSGADWVRFSPASVTLKPETSRDIVVEIDVPYKTKGTGDHRFALLATTLLPELDKRGDVSGVWNKYQLASLFYLTMMPSESHPKVTSVAFSETDKSMLTMSIKNDGDAHARLKGTAYIDYKVRFESMGDLVSGSEYKVNFKFQNSFVPQNKFRTVDVPVEQISFFAP